MMWLGQLVLLFMCLLITIGMSAPLITRLFGPPANVQTSYYNLVNAPLAIIMGLLLGVGPLMRWRRQDPQVLLRAVLPALVLAVALTLVIVVRGVRDAMPAGVIFAALFALAANTVVAVRGFSVGWRHGAAALGHMGVAMLLVGVVASSGYGVAAQVQLPQGEERQALGYSLTYQGRVKEPDGKDHVRIAVNSREGRFEASPALYWSEFNQGYMKKPHVERYLTHDVYISPLEIVDADPAVALLRPGAAPPGAGSVLAVELSTKPFINLVWLGSILMLASTFLIVFRRAQELDAVGTAEGAKTA
jgi:cytochrome c-type biogenesis protein CcmF